MEAEIGRRARLRPVAGGARPIGQRGHGGGGRDAPGGGDLEQAATDGLRHAEIIGAKHKSEGRHHNILRRARGASFLRILAAKPSCH